MALLTKQQKEETAGLVVSYLAQDLVIPMKLTTGLEKYIERGDYYKMNKQILKFSSYKSSETMENKENHCCCKSLVVHESLETILSGNYG